VQLCRYDNVQPVALQGLTIVILLRTSAIQANSFALGFASVVTANVPGALRLSCLNYPAGGGATG